MTEEKDLGQVLCVNNPVKVINVEEKHVNNNTLETKVYKRRWLMLCLFILYNGLSTFQWAQYSIITNIVSRYYGVSSLAIDWTAMTYMGYYVVFIFPSTYFVNRWGLRWGNIVGCSVACIGSWIKVLSVSPDRFYVTFIGQSLVASIQTLVLMMPGRLAAQWFDSNQVSTATSLSVFGNQMGVALSFLLTPMIVKNHENLDDIGVGLSHLFWNQAVIITIVLLLIVILFEDDPKLPPSEARAIQKLTQLELKESVLDSVKKLCKNKQFLMLCNSYGLGIGVVNVTGTLLNQIYVAHFENGEEDAGRIGLAMVLTGMLGSVSFGVIVDKTHKYKETTVIVYFLGLCGQLFFSLSTYLEIKWMVYLSAIFLGYFMVGYFALGYEMCAEYTYPEPEGTTGGILNVTNNLYGMVLVLIMGRLMEEYGDVPVHVGLLVTLVAGFVITVLTKNVKRRQDAKRNAAQYVVVNQSDENGECRKS